MRPWCDLWTVTASGEGRLGEAGEIVEQLVLEAWVVDGWMRVESTLVVPVAAGGTRVGVVARGEPLLPEVSESQVVGGAGSTHSRGYPAGVDGVAEHIRPAVGTAWPSGIVRVIPLLHGYLEIAVTLALIVLPFAVSLTAHLTALVFCLVVGVGGLVATLATPFEPRVRMEPALRLGQAA